MATRVEITESGNGPYGQLVRTGRHELLADEPEPTGRDSGPSPYEYLLAALGTCTSMTIRMYAERKQWPLERVAVRLSHDRVHPDDCANEGRCDHISRIVYLEGDLTDEQRARLMEIADRCPVHRTLTGDLRIETAIGSDMSAE